MNDTVKPGLYRHYGPCIYGCGRNVSEADSWGQKDDEYPPKQPYHVECRQRVETEKALLYTPDPLALRLVWCSYMMHVYGGFNAMEVPG